jgi:hypothetical protein
MRPRSTADDRRDAAPLVAGVIVVLIGIVVVLTGIRASAGADSFVVRPTDVSPATVITLPTVAATPDEPAHPWLPARPADRFAQ